MRLLSLFPRVDVSLLFIWLFDNQNRRFLLFDQSLSILFFNNIELSPFEIFPLYDVRLGPILRYQKLCHFFFLIKMFHWLNFVSVLFLTRLGTLRGISTALDQVM